MCAISIHVISSLVEGRSPSSRTIPNPFYIQNSSPHDFITLIARLYRLIAPAHHEFITLKAWHHRIITSLKFHTEYTSHKTLSQFKQFNFQYNQNEFHYYLFELLNPENDLPHS
jgi:hypothetical protein